MSLLASALAVFVAAGGWLGVRATPVTPATPASQPLEIALTVDDLTRPPFDPPLEPPEAVLARLTDAFARHGLPPVTGFVNGGTIEGHPAERAALEAWLRSGNRLGNHTWSHLDLAKVGVDAFMADVERNEPLLSALSGPGAADWRGAVMTTSDAGALEGVAGSYRLGGGSTLSGRSWASSAPGMAAIRADTRPNRRKSGFARRTMAILLAMLA